MPVEPAVTLYLITTGDGLLTDEFQPDDFVIVHACAAVLDVHKIQITATIRRQPPSGAATTLTNEFSALPSGLAALCAWLERHAVDADLMEGTGVYWQALFVAFDYIQNGKGVWPNA